MKVDKSLKEVWSWKTIIYQQMAKFNLKEITKKIHQDAEEIKKKYNLNLKTICLSHK